MGTKRLDYKIFVNILLDLGYNYDADGSPTEEDKELYIEMMQRFKVKELIEPSYRSGQGEDDYSSFRLRKGDDNPDLEKIGLFMNNQVRNWDTLNSIRDIQIRIWA